MPEPIRLFEKSGVKSYFWKMRYPVIVKFVSLSDRVYSLGMIYSLSICVLLLNSKEDRSGQ